jgi:trimeric autotransporter adhesin
VSFSSSSGNVSNFSFTMNSSFLAQGANFVTLQYTGDNTYAPSAFTLNSGGSIPNPLSDFTLVPDSSNVPVAVGKSGTANIYLSSVNGFSGAVNLKCAAAGVNCSIPSSTTLTSGSNGTVALTLSAPSAAANGNYNVMITAADSTGQYIHTLGLTAIVTGATSTTPGFTLSNSGDLSITAGATSGNTSTISVNPTNGFTGSVGLSCAVTTSPSGATSPVTCAMSPTSLTITSGALVSTLTVSSTSTTTAGAYAVTVSGVNGTNTQTSVVNVTVNAAPTGTFALSSSGSIIVTRGATTGNTSTIAVTPSGGFTGTVSLSCAITPTASNAAASCSLNPTSVNVTGASAQTVTLTVNTTAATAFNQPLKLFWPSTGGAVLAVLFFFVPRRRRNWLAMMGMLIVLVSGIAIGCGGGGIKSGGGNTGNTGTTPGTYTVTVTGTSGTTSKTATVSLTVN